MSISIRILDTAVIHEKFQAYAKFENKWHIKGQISVYIGKEWTRLFVNCDK